MSKPLPSEKFQYPPKDRDWMTVEEAAGLFNVSPQAIQKRWIDSGRVEHLVKDGQIQIPWTALRMTREELEKFDDARDAMALYWREWEKTNNRPRPTIEEILGE